MLYYLVNKLRCTHGTDKQLGLGIPRSRTHAALQFHVRNSYTFPDVTPVISTIPRTHCGDHARMKPSRLKDYIFVPPASHPSTFGRVGDKVHINQPTHQESGHGPLVVLHVDSRRRYGSNDEEGQHQHGLTQHPARCPTSCSPSGMLHPREAKLPSAGWPHC